VRLAGALAVCALAAVWAAAPAAAQAQLPPCDEAQEPAYSFESLPDRLIRHWPARFEVAFNSGASGSTGPGNIRVVVAAADPARPISHPYEQALLGAEYKQDEDGFWGHFELKFEATDGPARVSMTYPESHYVNGRSAECSRTVAKVVTPYDGLRPTVRVRNDLHSLRLLVLNPPAGCRDSAYGTVRVTVSGDGARRRLSAKDQCGAWLRPKSVRAPRWRLLGTEGERTNLATFEWVGRQNATRVFTYTITHAGRVLRRGQFRVVADFRPGQTIWDNTDAFVNYCINTLQEIRSKNHRLYCYRPSSLTTRIRVLK
jgi:hypothetical protein